MNVRQLASLMHLDWLLTLLGFLLIGLFRPDVVVQVAWTVGVVYLIVTRRHVLLQQFAIATGVAILWNIIAREQYGYNWTFHTLFGQNLYPLFAWAVGLFGVYLLYSHAANLIREGYLPRLLLFTGIYWPLLVLVESVSYHLFHIQNLATASFPGLPFCDCIHAPTWMQLAYFLIGPIFFSLCYAARLQNPHLLPQHPLRKGSVSR